jgi:ATP-binding cassette subfamily C protein
MLGVLRIFFAIKGATRWTVLLFLLLAGLAEGIGLSSLLPLFSVSGVAGGESSAPATQFIFGVFDRVGLPPTLEAMILLVVAAMTLKAVLRILAMRHVGYAAAEVATRLRMDLIDSLLNVRWSYFTYQPVGRIANAVSLEATRSSQAYVLAVQFIAGIVQCVFYVLVALTLSWKLAFWALGIGGLIALLLNTLVRTAKKAGRRQTRRTRELVVHLSDALVGIKPLKAMARQAHFASLFQDKAAELKRALRRQVVSTQILRNTQEPLLTICLAIAFYVAVTFWSMPMAELLVMGILLQRTVSRMNKMQRQLQEASIVESAYWSIHDLIVESKQERETGTGTLRPTLTRGCSIRDVSFAFGEKPVLQDISLEIPAKQITVILGASGVGKTTLTDLLLGLYRPDRGEIFIDGAPLAQIDLQAWRAMVGYVPQELILFHDTILANITLGDQSLGDEEARAALEAAGAWNFVSNLPDGLMTQVGERGIKLSGGERQRIALARALVHKPSLLILDEVTSALDPETESAICSNIRNLSSHLTILAITHRPAWTAVADRLFELDTDQYSLLREPESQTGTL